MAENVQLRVQPDVVTLEVNDNGDTVVLPVSDERFNKKIIEFVNKISDASEKINISDPEDIMGMIDADIAFHEMLHEEFNKLFGERAYEKVFGDDIAVGAEYVVEFIDKCMPYIQKYTAKRAEKFNKYSANRVGSSL